MKERAKGTPVKEQFNFALAVLYCVAKDEDNDEIRQCFAEAMELILKANRIWRGADCE